MEPNVIGYALQDFVFVAFRWLSAGIITGAAAYIVWHQMFDGRLKPTYVWNYVAVSLIVVATFRWFVILVTLPQMREFYDDIEPWLQPLTQAGYILMGMCFIVLTYASVKAREHRIRIHCTEPHCPEDELDD